MVLDDKKKCLQRPFTLMIPNKIIAIAIVFARLG